jgi:ABC-type transport system involved in multi-copper enzyme maturation permease subunit
LARWCLYDTSVKPCQSIGDCRTATGAFGNKYNFLQQLLTLLVQVAPALMGVFWGAPLIARELESGTHRLAWTQSVTRTRWLAIKLGLVGLATAGLAGLLSLAVTWWYAPLDKVGTNRFDGSIVGERGITPIGCAVFAFALGDLVGLLIRRTLPAMASTLVAFIAVRLVFSQLIRPHLLSPVGAAFALGSTVNGFVSSNGTTANLVAGAPNLPNAWIYSSRIINGSGQALSPRVTASACPQLANGGPPAGLPPSGSAHHLNAVPSPGSQQALQECAAKLSTTYHPRHLPARQPVLDLPNPGDGDLRRGCPRPSRRERLVATLPCQKSRSTRPGVTTRRIETTKIEDRTHQACLDRSDRLNDSSN